MRLHLAGFFWGDCSLSNALFRRDAGALQAYIIDVETSERYESLTDGQRQMDLDIATENVAGGLLDLQVGGRLVEDIDPLEIAANIEARYDAACGRELTGTEEFGVDEMWKVEQRLRRLHELGFDVGEMEVARRRGGPAAALRAPRRRERLPPGPAARPDRAVGRARTRPAACSTTSASFGAELQARTGTAPPENIAAVRWLDQRFEPIIGAIPPSMIGKLQAAEIYHQLLEHRWFECERQGREVSLEEALDVHPRRLAPASSRAPAARRAHCELFLGDLARSRNTPPSGLRPLGRPSSVGQVDGPPARRGAPDAGRPHESRASSSRSGRAGRRRRRWRRR